MLIYLLRWCIAPDMRIRSLRGSIGEGLLLWIILRPLCEPCVLVCVQCGAVTAGCVYALQLDLKLLCLTQGALKVWETYLQCLSVQQNSFHQHKWEINLCAALKILWKELYKSYSVRIMFYGRNFVGGKLWRHIKLFMLFEGICWTASTNWSNHRLASK